MTTRCADGQHLTGERWGQRVAAFMVRREPVGEDMLDSHCRASTLPAFKRPRAYAFVREILKSPVGKVLRRRLIAGDYDPAPCSTLPGGALPGFRGRLNSIRDSRDRTCSLAANVAGNQGEPRPVHFLPGEEPRLTDANGNERWARRRRHWPVDPASPKLPRNLGSGSRVTY